MRSDEELMLDYAAGDEGAFEELFSRFRGLVTGYMRRGYRSREDAADLTQQVFLQLHRARRDFRPGKPLRPWLMTIARNVLRDRIRKEKRGSPSLGLDQLLRDRAVGSGEEGRVALRESLDVAIDRLPATLRVVVVAQWREHLSHAQIAKKLGISRSAAKVRAHRAYRALREILVEQGYPGEEKANVTGGEIERSTPSSDAGGGKP